MKDSFSCSVDSSLLSNTETEGFGANGDDEGNTKSESQYGLVNIQSDEDSDSTFLVYSKISPNQDIDFQFPRDTICVKNLEFVHAEIFMHLMCREYRPTYKYRVVNDYCVNDHQRDSKFRDT